MSSFSQSTSRFSIDESGVGLLSEKYDFASDEHTTRIAPSLKSCMSSKLVITSPCLLLRYFARSLSQLFFLLLPSFLHPRHQNGRNKADKLPPTAFLDGMRGLAAFVVFICHLTYGSFDIGHAWGADPDSDSESRPHNQSTYRNFLRLPIVRLLYSGPPMVAIFFVISGYALSYKPLKLMRSQQHEQLMTTMSSSVFRRGLRLFLPCFASTFLVICLAQLNLYTITEDFAGQMRAIPEDHCYTQPDPWLQFTDWLQQMLIFVNVFDWSLFAGSVELDRHLWTIPVEFRCSLALFLTQMMVARMSTGLRMTTFVGLMTWGVSQDRWDLWPFWAGAVIAELDIIRTAKTLGSSSLSSTTQPLKPKFLTKFLCTLMIVISLFLLSYPDAAGHATPGYTSLTPLIPSKFTEKHRFWPTIGAIMIVWTTCHLDFLRKDVFCWSPIQYLGKISFPLYVVHGPIIHTLGYMTLPRTPEVETPEIMHQFELDFLKASVVIVITVIWVADVFLRIVDTPCVNLARRLEQRFLKY
ncbi:uncharacterized protein Z518_04457 [Rhinocladiella mackenziei CBS 650.93]|uniref:Acyltransferase 3 domain-containing protein n=1 Tax=Rhinocladiella mackenziei CBS 650.93 TaxID=1442369 RepID=A0A0D2ITJ8_9EURO|nr:uncharacterized protein Z518_04457 [Rhinocladiella mackenziei CBS 650.93]KIX06481.1 hypothetical protein Z518_04457 [Rhinocladiella mackenziei CBS 650.93]